MKTAIILLAVFGCALAVSDFQWNTYKTLYGKQYSNVAEEVTRRAIFTKTVMQIQEHNILNDLGLKSFRRGINSFTDLTSEEFRQRNGLRMPAVPKVGGNAFEQVSAESLPKTVDWRTKGYVTPIKDQAQMRLLLGFRRRCLPRGPELR